jgi:hypothetical protein
LKNWLQLLWENRFQVDLPYLPRALWITFNSMAMLPFRLFEQVRYARQIEATKVSHPPVFIIGHWRSGTTYLQNLMSLDQTMAYVAYVHTLLPGVFLGSGDLFRRVLARSMPPVRRMDQVVLGADRPAEEEFGIANLSPYSIQHAPVFIRNRVHYARFDTLEGLPASMVERWKGVYDYFLRKMTLARGGQPLLLKNPPNTSRIKLLLEMYPGAKFIHLHRDPYDVFASSVVMYEKAFPFTLLQRPEVDYKAFILEVYEAMYRKYLLEQPLIPKGDFVEVNYQDLIEDPFAVLQVIYSGLGLPGFEAAQGAFGEYIKSMEGFQVNAHHLTEGERARIAEQWGFTFEAFGYQA